MSTVRKREPISVSDYLAGELVSPIKHEYVGGIVYAMTGAKIVHNVISSNAVVALGYQLRGKKCQAFTSDMKIRVRLRNQWRFYYPDVSVVCQSNPSEDLFQDAPVVVIEVLSPSTRRTDTQEKQEAYLSLPSLGVYLLVEQSSAFVTVFRRQGSEFTTDVYDQMDQVIPLPEIDAELPLAELYARVEFVPEPEPE